MPPAHLYLDPTICAIHWVGCPHRLGLELNDDHRLGSADFWLSSSCMGGTVLVDIVMRQLWEIHGQWSRGQGALICSSVMFSPKKLARSLSSKGASPKSLARSNQTCFCTGPKGGYSATGLCGEGGHPSASMGAPPLSVLLLDSYCWGWRWNSLRSSLATCLWDVSIDGLEMEMCTCWVCWGKFQNMALGVRDSDAIVAHSYK